MRLTERDRHLCALLADGRWLTTEQVMRLVFPGRHERDVRKRLAALCAPEGAGCGALLRKHRWVTPTGLRQVWGLTELGYVEAGLLLDADLVVPPGDFAPETMAHHVALTELYVGLLSTPFEAAVARLPATLTRAARKRALTGLFARALHRAWRWSVVGDGLHLPWKVYEAGKTKDRVLRPDALLEFAEHSRRVFVECEMGTHTIQPVHDDTKPNSTVSKLGRWDAYVGGISDVQGKRTWYQQRFADAFVPEVLFLVQSDRRARNVGAAIEEWRKRSGTRLKARALTLAQALAEFAPLVGPAVQRQAMALVEPRPDEPTGKVAAQLDRAALSEHEARGLIRFFASARADLKKRQASATAANAALPAVPDDYETVKALVNRLHQEPHKGRVA